MNRQNSQSSILGFTIRSLILVIALCAIVVTIFGFFRQAARYPACASYDKWPRALVEMIGENLELRRDVEPYGFVEWGHYYYVWRIKSGSRLRDVLFAKNSLNRTDVRHPKAHELRQAVPTGWDRFPWNQCIWHATPGFGTVYMEGTDLYLIADDPSSGDTIVLHEWIF